MRKAKIICTLGPATDRRDVLEEMVRAGMDVARLNFSHGVQADHARRLAAVRRAAKAVGRPVAVLQDLQGPKIRLGRFEAPFELSAGEDVTITTRSCIGRPGLLPTPVRTLPRDVRAGDPVLIDDGRIRLRVEAVKDRDVRCRVEIGGPVKDHKGINLPGAAVSVSSLTRKDLSDLAFGLSLGVDYVALSFVRSEKDIERAIAAMGEARRPLIAKIEKPQAVEGLRAIAEAADGIMVARGDLGVELPLEKLPAIQKAAVREVNRLGKLTVVATEMLESMVVSARPTRAEVSDVANAILDGADAVMLSGETASGAHPVEAVATMARIVEETEQHGTPVFDRPFDGSHEISTGVAAAAVAAAGQLGIGTIAAYTLSGYTAKLISELRPKARVLGLTPDPATVRRMALYWGVQAVQVPRVHTTDGMLKQVRHLCLHGGYCARGEAVVIVAGVPLNQTGRTNLMSVHRI